MTEAAPGGRVVDELGLCHGYVRVDVASISADCLHGYELKADRDTLSRLPTQAEHYGAVMDRCTLVTGGAHLQEALQVVPPWWGVLRVEVDLFGLRFEQLREARVNPAPDPLATCRLLWRDEALAFLEELGAARGVRGKPRDALYARLVEVAPVDQLRAHVRQVLLKREDWRAS
ncbi:sce7726 family protein [Corallococcus sp. NCRR]|uniref:sce7726 family protein n=1 Tax=Corallococcus sp. NCRR TaxID=2996782 RepID=UPI0022A9847F|nr:sce7726 family protein [Corallococcus sp. NCRR]WAS89390.1 sce7726 family protein [Corallococcus sp. NCRR]